jgi:hypothetical protein
VRQGKEILRGLKIDWRKTQQQVRQLLEVPPKEETPAAPTPAAPEEKH